MKQGNGGNKSLWEKSCYFRWHFRKGASKVTFEGRTDWREGWSPEALWEESKAREPLGSSEPEHGWQAEEDQGAGREKESRHWRLILSGCGSLSKDFRFILTLMESQWCIFRRGVSWSDSSSVNRVYYGQTWWPNQGECTSRFSRDSPHLHILSGTFSDSTLFTLSGI